MQFDRANHLSCVALCMYTTVNNYAACFNQKSFLYKRRHKWAALRVATSAIFFLRSRVVHVVVSDPWIGQRALAPPCHALAEKE